jgi:hypothetical protein
MIARSGNVWTVGSRPSAIGSPRLSLGIPRSVRPAQTPVAREDQSISHEPREGGGGLLEGS